MSARAAASRTSGKPSCSGKPWPRLMAPRALASSDMVSKMLVFSSAKTGFMEFLARLRCLTAKIRLSHLAYASAGRRDDIGFEPPGDSVIGRQEVARLQPGL